MTARGRAAAVGGLADGPDADPQVTVAKGCHDGVFWQRQAPDQLRFLSAALGGGGRGVTDGTATR